MTIMPARTIVVLFEPFLLFTTLSSMRFFGFRILMSRFGIDVRCTKLLTTFPAPRLTATGSNEEIICTTRKPTRKNVITRIVLETPPLTPRTLLGVHLTWGWKIHSSVVRCFFTLRVFVLTPLGDFDSGLGTVGWRTKERS